MNLPPFPPRNSPPQCPHALPPAKWPSHTGHLNPFWPSHWPAQASPLAFQHRMPSPLQLFHPRLMTTSSTPATHFIHPHDHSTLPRDHSTLPCDHSTLLHDHSTVFLPQTPALRFRGSGCASLLFSEFSWFLVRRSLGCCSQLFDHEPGASEQRWTRADCEFEEAVWRSPLCFLYRRSVEKSLVNLFEVEWCQRGVGSVN